ncbi:MAG: pyridoxamine 5'-phosphate oxidase [Myxococcales bacterium]|jgi:pyridoxamine 5'-phosphate oxidase|nr:pyridoxamine 5'-phosphate oxidase [Myxococcales bacterium]HIK84240.1 pyridoxamine 5'-phosphate oxidase [Myxococcales bacterium]
MEEERPDLWLAVDPLPSNPAQFVKQWLGEAFAGGIQANPHAVALATVDADGRPSVRMVLCNEIEPEAAEFTMYTNTQSRKGRAIRAEPRCAIVFHWPSRQARIEGRASLTPDEKCDAYFATRPLEARLGAWASAQSEPIGSRTEMLAKLADVSERFGATKEEDPVPRPPHWGGFTLVANSIELWVSREGRIHDRAVWQRSEDTWVPTRLQP